jgi:hypothetical protein
MTQDAEGLKACPFCSDDTPLSIERIPVVVRSPDGSERHITDYAVTCDTCDTLGPPASSVKDARDLWNLRAPSPVSALVEFTREELVFIRTEFHASLSNGAEDPLFERVYQKARAALKDHK